jgi:hypothetical protein
VDEDLRRREFLRWGGAAAAGALAVGATAEPAKPSGARAEDFGAVGDGHADDTAALQRAADSGAGALWLSPGRTYLIDRLLLPYVEGFTLEGNGALLRKRDDGDNEALIAGLGHAHNDPWAGLPLQIRNLRLDGAGIGKACIGLALQNWNSRLFNLAVSHMSGDGIRFASATRDGTKLRNGLVNNWIDFVTVDGCGGHGIHIADPGGNKCTDWYIGGGWIYDNAGWGIWADECAGAQVGPKMHLYGNKGGGLYAANWSIGTVLSGIYFEEGQTCALPGGWRPGIIADCWFTGNARLEVQFASGGADHKRVFVRGCHFQGESHILHQGGADRTVEVMGCLFDTADPLRRTHGGAYHATRCWAERQNRLLDGPQ